MAYPRKPSDDIDKSLEAGDNRAPEMPLPDTLPRVSATGGAPKLNREFEPEGAPQIPAPNNPASPTPYYKRMSPPQAPRYREVYPQSPWSDEEIEAQWGEFIEKLQDKIWERLKTLPAERRASPAWQQVANNNQQMAKSIVAQMLTNAAGVERTPLDEKEAQRISEDDVYQWFRSLRR